MTASRRTFVKWSAALAGAVGDRLARRPPAAGDVSPVRKSRHVSRAPAPLSILVIGGTGFTGPEQVECALERGHRVTVINRNRTRPDFFKGKAQVEQLVGDLNADMSALQGRTFDAFTPIPQCGVAITGAQGVLREVCPGDIPGQPDHSARVDRRPLDPSDRFTYWRVRIDKGGEILAPGNGSDPVQFIDARDLEVLAAWRAQKAT